MRAYIKPGPHIVQSVPSHPPQHALFQKDGVRVHEAIEGTPYVDLTSRQSETGDVPRDIDDLVTEYSLNTGHYGGGTNTSRKTGVYRLHSATATVTRDRNGQHTIEVRGRDAKDVRRLAERIVAGTIPPMHPYERPQVAGKFASIDEAFHQLVESLGYALDSLRFFGR